MERMCINCATLVRRVWCTNSKQSAEATVQSMPTQGNLYVWYMLAGNLEVNTLSLRMEEMASLTQHPRAICMLSC
eukprot:3237050-Amphidinium_carterae.2